MQLLHQGRHLWWCLGPSRFGSRRHPKKKNERRNTNRVNAEVGDVLICRVPSDDSTPRRFIGDPALTHDRPIEIGILDLVDEDAGEEECTMKEIEMISSNPQEALKSAREAHAKEHKCSSLGTDLDALFLQLVNQTRCKDQNLQIQTTIRDIFAHFELAIYKHGAKLIMPVVRALTLVHAQNMNRLSHPGTAVAVCVLCQKQAALAARISRGLYDSIVGVALERAKGGSMCQVLLR